uniref:Uncharacterized protein n=1 Tax=Neospora caninum (strain Liverpool) TaxID=572307 RepID=A0A0F7UIC7_NEOCL|nr:TPA: hypothetical protein BN1204_041335 [Neospora caninum Liverpool]
MASPLLSRPIRSTASQGGTSHGAANGENDTEGTSGQWLLEWFPGFDIPIGLEGRAYLRRLLNHRRAEDPAAFLLAAHGIKLGRGVPGHTSNWGSMKVKELLHAAYLLGCWSAVERLCINFCQANGLKTEWIQELKAKGGRQSVTLANLQNYRKRFRDSEKKRGQQHADPPPHSLVSPAEDKDSRIISGKQFGATAFTSTLGDSKKREAVVPPGQSETSASTTATGSGNQNTGYVPSKTVSSSSAAFPPVSRPAGEVCFDSATALEDASEHLLNSQDGFCLRGNQPSAEVRERHRIDSNVSGSIPPLLPPPEYESLTSARRPRTKKRGSRGRTTTSSRGKRKRSQANMISQPVEMPEVTYMPATSIQDLPSPDEKVQIPEHRSQKSCYFHQTHVPLEALPMHSSGGEGGPVHPPLANIPQVLGQAPEPATPSKLQWPPEANSVPSSSFLFLPYGEGERRLHLPLTKIHQNCPPPCIPSNHLISTSDACVTCPVLSFDRTTPNPTVEGACLEPPLQEKCTVNFSQQVSTLKESYANHTKTRERSCSSESWRSESSWSQSSQASTYSTCTTSTSSEEGEPSTPCSVGSWKRTNRKRRIAQQVNFAGKKPRQSQLPSHEDELRRAEALSSSTGPLPAPFSSVVSAVLPQHPHSVPHYTDKKTVAEMRSAFSLQPASYFGSSAPQDRLSRGILLPATADAPRPCSESCGAPLYALRVTPSSLVPPPIERHTHYEAAADSNPFGCKTPAFFPCDLVTPPAQDGSASAASFTSRLEAIQPLVGHEKTCVGGTELTSDGVSGDRFKSEPLTVPPATIFNQGKVVDMHVEEPRSHRGTHEDVAGRLTEGDSRSHAKPCFPPQLEFPESAQLPRFSASSEAKAVEGVGLPTGYYTARLLTAQALNLQCRSPEQPQNCDALPASHRNMELARSQEIRCNFEPRRSDFPQPSANARYDRSCALNASTFSQIHSRGKLTSFDVQSISAFDCGEFDGGAKHASEGSCLISPAKSDRSGLPRESCEKVYGAGTPEATSSVYNVNHTKRCSGMAKNGIWGTHLKCGQPTMEDGAANVCFLEPEKSSCPLNYEPHLQRTAPDPPDLERTTTCPAADAMPERVACERKSIAEFPSITNREISSALEEVAGCIHPVTAPQGSSRKGALTQSSVPALSSPTCEERESAPAFTSVDFKENSYCLPYGRSLAAPAWKVAPSSPLHVHPATSVRKRVEDHTPVICSDLGDPSHELRGSHSNDSCSLLETRYQFCCGDPGQPATVRLTVRSPFT